MSEKCPVCKVSDITDPDIAKGLYNVECPRCGHYQISQSAVRCVLAADVAQRRHLLSGLLRNAWELTGRRMQITSDVFSAWENVRKIAPLPIPGDTDVPAKADLFLQALRRKTQRLGDPVELDSSTDYAIGFCAGASECDFCLDYLQDQGLVVKIEAPGFGCLPGYRITPPGWAYLNGIGAETKDQGFVAMAFKEELKPVWTDGLFHGIENAGYRAMRIDCKEHNNSITDEIVAEIRKSRFVVADLTGKNAGAYFEAGFAMGLGKPVIWTCQQSEIDAGNVHFDTRQYSIVPWIENEWPDFAKRLSQRIEATLGRGRYKHA